MAKFVYFCFTRIIDFHRVIQIYPKFANFVGLYCPCFQYFATKLYYCTKFRTFFQAIVKYLPISNLCKNTVLRFKSVQDLVANTSIVEGYFAFSLTYRFVFCNSTNFLDRRAEILKNSLQEHCNDFSPVILLMYNINMYRGKKQHDRLFKELGPKMWNFTGRAEILPDLFHVKELLSCEENTCRSQINITSLSVEHILLDKKTFLFNLFSSCVYNLHSSMYFVLALRYLVLPGTSYFFLESACNSTGVENL